MPNNWKTYKLSEITNVITKGTTPSTYGFGFIDKGVNFIKSESTNYDGRLDETVFVKVSEEAHNKLKRSQLEEDDILFSMAGAYLGKTGMVYKNHLPANTNQANGIIRVNKNKALPKFVSFLLRNPSLISYVNASAGQSAQPNINLADIGSLEFKLPPLQEQQAIASILSTIDDKIENNLAINKTLEEMAMALYKHWFVDFSPFQEGEFVESELGMIPKGWEVKSLENIGDFKNGKGINASKRSEDGKYIILGSNGIIGRTNEIMFKEPVIAIGRVGANYGEVHFSIEPCWISDNAITVQPQIKNNYWLIYQILKEVDYSNFATGSAQPLITQSSVKALKFSCPDLESLDLYSSKIEMLYNKRNENLTENQSLTQVRDTLLPQLINGTVRLKEFRKTIEEVV